MVETLSMLSKYAFIALLMHLVLLAYTTMYYLILLLTVPPTTLQPKKQLTITTMVTPPYLMQSSGMPEMFEGYIVDLVHRLSELVPFDYQWRLQRGFGTKSRNRRGEVRWSGMIGDIINGVRQIDRWWQALGVKNQSFFILSPPLLLFNTTFAVNCLKPLVGWPVSGFIYISTHISPSFRRLSCRL